MAFGLLDGSLSYVSKAAVMFFRAACIVGDAAKLVGLGNAAPGNGQLGILETDDTHTHDTSEIADFT